MKQLLNITVVVLLTLSSVSCVLEDESSRSTEGLATTLWYRSKEHIDIVRKGVEEAIHIGNIMMIADADKKAQYLDSHFVGATLTTTNLGYVINMPTDYGTSISWSVTHRNNPFGEGEWTISRSGGQSYELTISPQTSGDMIAQYAFYYNGAQRGEAFLRFTYEQENVLADIRANYVGIIEVVDDSESAKSPLYLTINLRRPLAISENYGIMSGEVDIECVDTLYGSTDSISVSISESSRQTVVECYGECYTLN